MILKLLGVLLAVAMVLVAIALMEPMVTDIQIIFVVVTGLLCGNWLANRYLIKRSRKE